MATLKEYIYDIWQSIQIEVDDNTFLDERDIRYFIHLRRAMWLKNQLTKINTIGSQATQSIKVNLSDINYLFGKAKKSTAKIPELLEVKTKTILNRVYYDTLSIPINLAEHIDIPHLGSGRFNTNEVFALVIDDFLYLVTKGTGLDNPFSGSTSSINISGIFRNPEDVPGFKDTDTYPIPDGYWQYIKGDILQYDIAPMLRTNKDARPPSKENEGKPEE